MQCLIIKDRFLVVFALAVMEEREHETIKESSKIKEPLVFGIVANIPAEFHSSDLRSFFSQFIESKGFDCFHFRHRPEISPSNEICEKNSTGKTTCCVVRLLEVKLDELIKKYHGQHWVNSRGNLLSQRAVIKRIKIGKTIGDNDEKQYLTKEQMKQQARDKVDFVPNDLEKLSELSPPPIMPNGNVGTPLEVFAEFIRTCSFPPKLIKKLGLKFPKSFSQKKYGNVPLDYSAFESKSSARKLPVEHNVMHENVSLEQTVGTVQTISEKSKEFDTSSNTSNLLHNDDSNVKHVKQVEGANNVFHYSHNESCSDDENELEEWDRHENLHNDVDNQARTKERLFEEEIELKWEKGGSGLVFYTDAQFWQKQENADFDEETADDWDVDMSIYEEPDGGDKDARDLLQMRIEEQWRRGNVIDPNRVGGFERHTRGFGGHLMRHQGWKEGQGLGNSCVGLAKPIEAEGQSPASKRGLGYYGEKLNRKVKRTCGERDVVIKTIYDDPDERNSNPYLTQSPHVLTYRDSIEFVPSKNSKNLKH